MVTKEIALQIQKRALAAVVELHTILLEVRDEVSDEDLQIIKRGVGLSIGKIQTDLLDPIYEQHPEIDDLKN